MIVSQQKLLVQIAVASWSSLTNSYLKMKETCGMASLDLGCAMSAGQNQDNRKLVHTRYECKITGFGLDVITDTDHTLIPGVNGA